MISEENWTIQGSDLHRSTLQAVGNVSARRSGGEVIDNYSRSSRIWARCGSARSSHGLATLEGAGDWPTLLVQLGTRVTRLLLAELDTAKLMGSDAGQPQPKVNDRRSA